MNPNFSDGLLDSFVVANILKEFLSFENATDHHKTDFTNKMSVHFNGLWQQLDKTFSERDPQYAKHIKAILKTYLSLL